MNRCAQKDEENESLCAEIAALLQGSGVSEAVMDRIARLEKAVADSNAQLRDARAANSALAAENLGIKSKSKRNRYESDVKPPNPYGTVTVRRPREDPPVSVRMTADQTRCIHGHPLSEPTETVTRSYWDIIDGSLVGIECRVVRRYCRACRRQTSANVPGVIPKERFGVNLMSLEALMRILHPLRDHTVAGQHNLPHQPCQVDGDPPRRHRRKVAHPPLRVPARGDLLLQARIRRRDDVAGRRRAALAVDAGKRRGDGVPCGQAPGRRRA